MLKLKSIILSILLIIAILTSAACSEFAESGDDSQDEKTGKVEPLTAESKENDTTAEQKSTVREDRKSELSDRRSVSVGSATFEISSYWEADKIESDHYEAYAENTSDKLAMLEIIASYDEEDPVTYATLKLANEKGKMAESIGAMFNKSGDVHSEDFGNNNNVRGFIYSYSFVESDYSGQLQCTVFPSTEDHKWIFVCLIETDNTEYTYSSEYKRILDSIVISNAKETVKETETAKETESVTTQEESMGAWEIGEFRDEFNQPSGKKYVMYTTVDGTYSDSFSKNKSLAAIVQVGNGNIAFGLLKDLDTTINCYFGRDEYSIVVLDQNNKKHNYKGYLKAGEHRIFLDSSYKKDMIKILSKSGKIRIYIEEISDYSYSTYLFDVVTDGFKVAYSKI